MSLIDRRLLPAAGLLLLGLIGSVAGNVLQWRRAAVAREAHAGQLLVCTDANARSTAVRRELQAALDACAGQQRDLQAAISTALAERDAALARARIADRRRRAALETIYANDAECRTWRDQPVCRAVSERLQRDAAGE